MSVDLHLHTHYSDGSWSPARLVERAAELRLSCIAVTDHDTVAGIVECCNAAPGNLKVIPGIEVNTIWARPDGQLRDVHILGYYINPESSSIEDLVAAQQQARLAQIEETLERLNRHGIRLTTVDLRQSGARGSIGRPHLSTALFKTGAAKTIEQAYNMIMKRDSPFYVPRRSVSPAVALRAIEKSGGISSLAHPGKDKDLPDLLPHLIKHGLQAIEAYHPSHRGRLVRRYLSVAAELGLLVTGGSDCHGPFEGFPGSIGTVKVPAHVVEALEQARQSLL